MDDGVRIGVDVGGTFTDVVLAADGDLTTAKVPTTDDQSKGVADGIEVACERAGVEPAKIGTFRHATTVAVNAVLEGTGATTALLTTDGVADVLDIGRQDRPELYDQTADKPEPLVPAERRITVDERATTAGIEREVDPDDVRDLADELPDDVEAVAVSFLHAYAHPDNERRAVEVLADERDVAVSASHDVLAEFREYERTATTVVDAYVTPVVDDYLARLQSRAEKRGLPAPRVMQSNGGIAAADTVREHAVTTVLSGPAAGVVGAGAFEPARADGIVTFDMGGTSSDVSLVRDGEVERTTDADVGGHPVRVPMVDVNTVGAGGGSIAWVDEGGALRVGPRSAGADPGPACYDRGGTEPTVTDANLQLGYLGAETTLGEGLELDADAAESVLTELAGTAGLDGSLAAARGAYRVANATMARAIRNVTVERGHDPRTFALCAFGGAGPMHAAALAERLGIERVLVPRASGVLSAFGLLRADETHDAVRTRRVSLSQSDPDAVEAVYRDLADEARADATEPESATVEYAADMRYGGQSHELTVTVPEEFDVDAVREQFHDAHERVRGYRMDDEPVEIVSLRATATIPGTAPTIEHTGEGEARTGRRTAYFDGWHETPVYDRRRLAPDREIEGPAIFEGGESTVVCPPDWTVTVDERGTLRMEVDE